MNGSGERPVGPIGEGMPFCLGLRRHVHSWRRRSGRGAPVHFCELPRRGSGQRPEPSRRRNDDSAPCRRRSARARSGRVAVRVLVRVPVRSVWNARRNRIDSGSSRRRERARLATVTWRRLRSGAALASRQARQRDSTRAGRCTRIAPAPAVASTAGEGAATAGWLACCHTLRKRCKAVTRQSPSRTRRIGTSTM